MFSRSLFFSPLIRSLFLSPLILSFCYSISCIVDSITPPSVRIILSLTPIFVCHCSLPLRWNILLNMKSKIDSNPTDYSATLHSSKGAWVMARMRLKPLSCRSRASSEWTLHLGGAPPPLAVIVNIAVGQRSRCGSLIESFHPHPMFLPGVYPPRCFSTMGCIFLSVKLLLERLLGFIDVSSIVGRPLCPRATPTRLWGHRKIQGLDIVGLGWD